MGLPTGVLGAYGRHMEALRVRGVYARSVGAPADRQAAIPQGCPWSMTFLSALMTVWARALRRLCPAAIPRALADDLLVAVHAEGPDENDTVLEDHTSAVATTI
eukprot:6648729-Alexandrium_andersonii.AAC.1